MDLVSARVGIPAGVVLVWTWASFPRSATGEEHDVKAAASAAWVSLSGCGSWFIDGNLGQAIGDPIHGWLSRHRSLQRVRF